VEDDIDVLGMNDTDVLSRHVEAAKHMYYLNDGMLSSLCRPRLVKAGPGLSRVSCCDRMLHHVQPCPRTYNVCQDVLCGELSKRRG
jgi:hypothetical protein